MWAEEREKFSAYIYTRLRGISSQTTIRIPGNLPRKEFIIIASDDIDSHIVSFWDKSRQKVSRNQIQLK